MISRWSIFPIFIVGLHAATASMMTTDTHEEDTCQCFGGSLLLCQRALRLPLASESFCSNASHLMILDANGEIPIGAVMDTWLPNLRRVDIEGLNEACRKAIQGARNYVVVCHARPLVKHRRAKRGVSGTEVGVMGLAGASLAAQLSFIIAAYKIYRQNVQPLLSTFSSSSDPASDYR